jgi:hypothetical protein
MAKSTSPQPIDLSSFVGTPVQSATRALTKAGLQVAAPQQVAGPLGMVYSVVNLATSAWPGAVVEPVVLGTTVMGFRVDPQAQIESLQRQVGQLQGRTVAGAPPTPTSRRSSSGPKE